MHIKQRIAIQLLLAIIVVSGLAAALPTASADVTGIFNPSFEDATNNHLDGWSTAGTSIFPTQSSYFNAPVSPTAGVFQIVVNKEQGVTTTTTLAAFLGVSTTELASVIGDGDLSDLSESHGAAIKQHFTLNTASTLKFDYNLFTTVNTSNQTIYPETIVAVLDGLAYFVKDTDTATFTANDGTYKWAGYSTFNGLPTLSAGAHEIGVAAIGQVNSAGFELDNFVTTTVAVPEASPLLFGSVLTKGLLCWRRLAR